MSAASAWWQSARPLAQANIAAPLVVGQAMAFAVEGRFDPAMAVAVHAFGVIDQLLIVWANDYADREDDADNDGHTLVSGGSRVLVEGKITPRALGRAAVAAALALLALSVAMAVVADRPGFVVAWAFAVGLLWLYSYPPARLSYRGGGELLQAAGLGLVLPALGYHAHAGDVSSLPWWVLASTFALGWASHITTALPDTPADERCGKRTWPVRVGEDAARRTSLWLVVVGAALAAWLAPALSAQARLALVAAPAAPVLVNALGSSRAGSEHRAACLRFVILNGAAIQIALIALAVALILSAR